MYYMPRNSGISKTMYVAYAMAVWAAQNPEKNIRVFSPGERASTAYMKTVKQYLDKQTSVRDDRENS